MLEILVSVLVADVGEVKRETIVGLDASKSFGEKAKGSSDNGCGSSDEKNDDGGEEFRDVYSRDRDRGENCSDGQQALGSSVGHGDVLSMLVFNTCQNGGASD